MLILTIAVSAALGTPGCIPRAVIEHELDPEVQRRPGNVDSVVDHGSSAIPALLDIVADYRDVSVAWTKRHDRSQTVRVKADRRVGIRLQAVFALGFLIVSDDIAAQVVPKLLAIARDQEDPDRGDAVESMGEMGTPTGVAALRALLPEFCGPTPHDRECYAVIDVLCSTPSPEGRVILSGFATGDHEMAAYIAKYKDTANHYKLPAGVKPPWLK